jgi:hypothetical protein
MLVNIPYMDPMGILYSLSDHFLFFLFAKTRTLRTAWPRHVSGHLAGGERFHRTVPIGHQTCLGEFGGTAAVTEVPPSDYFNGQWRINIEIKKDGFRWYIYGLMMVISLNLGLWLYRGFIRKYLLKMVIFQFATSNHHRVSVEKPAEIPAVFCLFDFNLWISAYIITQYHTYIYIHMYIRSIDWESPWKPRTCGCLTLLGFAASKNPLVDDFSIQMASRIVGVCPPISTVFFRTLRMNRRRKPTPRSKTVSTAGCPGDISVKIRDFHLTTWYLAGVSCHQSHEIEITHTDCDHVWFQSKHLCALKTHAKKAAKLRRANPKASLFQWLCPEIGQTQSLMFGG